MKNSLKKMVKAIKFIGLSVAITFSLSAFPCEMQLYEHITMNIIIGLMLSWIITYGDDVKISKNK